MRIRRFASLGTLLAWALLAAGPGLADDGAERRRLATELAAIAPYSDAQAAADFEVSMVDSLKGGFKERYTAYADSEAKVAARQAWATVPPFNAWVIEELGARLTVEELAEAITFTRSPLAEKARRVQQSIATIPDEPSRLAAMMAAFTESELEQFVAMQQRPAMAKYISVLQSASLPMGEKLADVFLEKLLARCPQKTAPLPWCK